MLTLALQLGIIATLITGSKQDLKERLVSIKYQGIIILLSIPLAYINRDIVGLANWLAICLFAMTYILNGIGGADLKALIPILFSIGTIGLMAFVVGMSIAGLFLSWHYRRHPQGIPYFVAITAGYIGMVAFNQAFGRMM